MQSQLFSLFLTQCSTTDALFRILMQGLDGPAGDKGDDGEAGQAVSIAYQLCYLI